jgi:hypothetical protein
MQCIRYKTVNDFLCQLVFYFSTTGFHISVLLTFWAGQFKISGVCPLGANSIPKAAKCHLGIKSPRMMEKHCSGMFHSDL